MTTTTTYKCLIEHSTDVKLSAYGVRDIEAGCKEDCVEWAEWWCRDCPPDCNGRHNLKVQKIMITTISGGTNDDEEWVFQLKTEGGKITIDELKEGMFQHCEHGQTFGEAPLNTLIEIGGDMGSMTPQEKEVWRLDKIRIVEDYAFSVRREVEWEAHLLREEEEEAEEEQHFDDVMREGYEASGEW